MNCPLIFSIIISIILLDWMTIIVSAVECPPNQNLPVDVMARLRVIPPSPEELLNEVYAYIEECPHSPVSDIKTVLLSHWTAYYGGQGLPNSVDNFCSRVFATPMRTVTINYILACRFIQNYVMVQLQHSRQTETDMEIMAKIQGAYGKLQQGANSKLSSITHISLRGALGGTVASINSVVEYCDRVILPRPANLPMFAVVTCDFIKKYQHSIRGRLPGQ